MPNFYNYIENGLSYNFDDVFVPADAFRQGNLFGAGSNGYGRLGNNVTSSRSLSPVTTFSGGTNWKQVSGGMEYTAAIKTDGTLWTWGRSAVGQLGINVITPALASIATPVTTFSGGTNWKQVACGGYHTAAIKTNGTLWTWGRNVNGQLGDNTTTNRCTPVTTFSGGTNWKQVACGFDFVAAIKTDGTLWTWGRNFGGALGNNFSAANVTTPVTTFAGGNNWKQVDCGLYHAAAIKTDGTLWVWGQNSYRQSGNGESTSSATPITTFAGGTNWKQVGCGGYHTSAIKTDGTLWTWGRNDYAQIGDNTGGLAGTNRCTPVTTFAGGTNWKNINVFNCWSRATAAIKTDGTLWVWGGNNQGQLGVNDQNNRSTPVTTFAGGTNWKQVAAAQGHTLAITYIDDYQ